MDQADTYIWVRRLHIGGSRDYIYLGQEATDTLVRKLQIGGSGGHKLLNQQATDSWIRRDHDFSGVTPKAHARGP